MKKRVLFLTGTRADYGKIKPLICALQQDPAYEVFVFVCGMHLSEKFGSTYQEVLMDGYQNVYVAFGLTPSQNSCVNLGNTICTLSSYVENVHPDMIVVHGDRMDALAGAVVGALNNVLVAHIEGGELSGTIDESTRHAISKFAHVHFVCNEDAKNRLIQMGEESGRIFVIGSPDIDMMMRNDLPALEDVKQHYGIPFDRYAIFMYHPVTTEYPVIREKIRVVVDAVKESGRNFVVVYPNNDLGSDVILAEYGRLANDPHFKVFPSLRFERFLTLLKNADFIIGNSSAGVREAGIYGVPAIDIGTRQSGRYAPSSQNILHLEEEKAEILAGMERIDDYRHVTFIYGNGNSTQKFIKAINTPGFWDMEIQKHFVDLD